MIHSETITGTLNQALTYTYNNDFALASTTYAGATVNYTYDADGLLSGAGAFTITRDNANGLPVAVSDGGMTLSQGYNGYGELASASLNTVVNAIASWSVTRDDAARITQKTETLAGQTSDYAYTYDPMGRLLSVTKNGSLVEEYGYGPNGNRTYEMNALRGITGRTFSYSDEDHLVTTGDATYEYDEDGYLTRKTVGTGEPPEVTSYVYSSRGELLSLMLPDGRLIEYIHDPLGRRIAKKVDGEVVEKHLWQGLTRLLAVYDGGDNLLMRLEYADGRMPLAMTRGGVTYYLAYDQVGSLRAVADTAGNVVKRIDYDSFGNIIADTNPLFDIPFGFAGGLHDSDTGLVRFGFRDYDPDTGRWSAKDPMLFQGGETDLYRYALNDPINFWDPDGLLTDVMQNPGLWWAGVASGASAMAEGVAASATAIAAASVAAVAAAGAAGYFGASALIKGTWLAGGIGVLAYDISHPQPTKTVETEGEPWQPDQHSPCKQVDPEDFLRLCIAGCRGKYSNKFFRRQICIIGCILAAF